MKRTDMYDASVHVHTYPRACTHTTYTNTGRYAQMCTHIQTSILALSLSHTHACRHRWWQKDNGTHKLHSVLILLHHVVFGHTHKQKDWVVGLFCNITCGKVHCEYKSSRKCRQEWRSSPLAAKYCSCSKQEADTVT